MSRRNLFLSAAGLAAVALFLAALVHLVLLRYGRGDLYPANSTLRADPLGTRALYEAVSDAGGYEVRRGLVSLHRELAQKPATLFILGLEADEIRNFAPEEVSELSDYVRQGGRVVMTLAPTNDAPGEATAEKEKDEEKKVPKPPPIAIPEPPGQPKTAQEKYEREQFRKDQEREAQMDPTRFIPDQFHPSLLAAWGFGWTVPAARKESNSRSAVKNTDSNSLGVEYSPHGDVLAVRTGPAPAEIRVPWKSPVSFVRIEPAWKVDYEAKGKPVFITRLWGRGEIIVAGDSYFMSNEALRDDREPRLLSWLAGPPGLLLFDETHLGTQEREGVMVLARRFRLEGYLYGLVLVTGLFLWRQSVPLVPPAPSGRDSFAGGVVSGKDSRSGLINLLRRNIGLRDLLPTCLAQWRRHRPVEGSASHLAEMEAALLAAGPQPDQILNTYRRLCEINRGGRTRKTYANQS